MIHLLFDVVLLMQPNIELITNYNFKLNKVLMVFFIPQLNVADYTLSLTLP